MNEFLIDEKDYVYTIEDIVKLQQENQELKKQLEEYKLITIDYQELEARNKELKKQLEEYKRLGFKHLNDKCNKLENQQKEFIKYLEEKICIAGKVLDKPEEDEEVRGYVLARKFMLEEILSKYKEIIGGKDER